MTDTTAPANENSVGTDGFTLMDEPSLLRLVLHRMHEAGATVGQLAALFEISERRIVEHLEAARLYYERQVEAGAASESGRLFYP